MIARTLTVDVGPERVDDVVETYRRVVRPVHERAAGLSAHYVLADRSRGRIHIIGVWDSAEAVSLIATELEPARQQLWDAFSQAPELEIYEVADRLVP